MTPATLLPIAALLAASLPQDAPSTEPGDRLELETLAGEVRSLPLEGVDLADPRTEGAAFVRFPDVELDAASARVELVDGGRLAADVDGGEGERLDLSLPGGSSISLGVDWLRSLQFPGRFPADAAAPAPAKEGDRLYLTRARGVDRVDGFVVGFNDEGLRFESRVGERTHPWDEVVALFVEPLEAPQPSEASVPVSVTLRGGGRLGADCQRVRASGVELTFAGARRTLTLDDVAELVIDDGSFTFLSGLEPSDLGPLNPFDPPGTEPLGMGWPPRMDAAVGGGPLDVGGRRWTRGIGVHAPSRVTWTLEPGAWSELRVACGVEDGIAGQARKGGTVRFRVLVDGEQAWESHVVRAGEPVGMPTRIELAGASSLVLEVDPVDDWVLDRAAWLRPILVRASR